MKRRTKITSQYICTIMIRKLILSVSGLLLLASLQASDNSLLLSQNIEVGAPQPSVQTAEESLSQPATTGRKTKVQYVASLVAQPTSSANYKATPLCSSSHRSEVGKTVSANTQSSLNAGSQVTTSTAQSGATTTLSVPSVRVASSSMEATEKNHSERVGKIGFPKSSFMSTSMYLSARDRQSFVAEESSTTPIRRVDWGGDTPNEPFPDPVGEVPFCLMALLVAAFVLYKRQASRKA